MRLVLLAVLLVGCGDDIHGTPDAAVDGRDIDALHAGEPDFYGEACSPPSMVGTVVLCRLEDPYPHGYCTPEGICRPFCSHVPVTGSTFDACKNVHGVETQAFPSSPAHVCYCEPRS